MNPRAQFDLLQYDHPVFHLADGTGSVGFAGCDLIPFHDLLKFRQDTAQFIHLLIAQFPGIIRLCSQLNPVPDMINLPDLFALRHFKYFHGKFIGSDINRRKGFHTHCQHLTLFPADNR